MTARGRFVLPLLLGSMLALVGCSEKGARFATVEQDGRRLEVPLDPRSEIARIDHGSRGLVRVFGDGRVVVQPRDGDDRGQLAQFVLTRDELDALASNWARSGVFSAGAREVAFPALATDSLPFGITLHLALCHEPDGTAVRPCLFNQQIYNPDLQRRYGAAPGSSLAPEASAILDAFELLLSFRTHPGLAPIDVPVGRPTIPDWAQPDASSPPQLLVRHGSALWLMDWLGGNRKKLSALPERVFGRVSVGPFGDELAYRSLGHGLILTAVRSEGSSGDPPAVSLRSLGVEDGHTPVFSGDGRWLAFLGKKDARWRLLVLNLRTRSLRESARGLDALETGRPVCWSPDGERLYFEVIDRFASLPGPGVWVADHRSVRPVLRGPATGTRLAPGGGYAAYLAPVMRDTAEGKRVEDQRFGSSRVLPLNALWVVGIDRRHGACLRPCRPARVAVGVSEFDWAPDGSRLVYVAKDDRGSALWVADRKGGGSQLLVREDVGPFLLFQPNWSPRGEAIVFLRSKPRRGMHGDGGQPELWILGADGTDLRRVTNGSDPIWWGETQTGIDDLAD